MRFRFTLLLFLATMPALAADQLVQATVTITNAPTTNGQSIVWNGNTRRWTNTPAADPSVWIQTNLTIGGSATNLYDHFSTYPYPLGAGSMRVARSSTNGVVFFGNLNTTMTVTIGGGWASVSYTTQTVATAGSMLVRVPISQETGTNYTNIASLLVKAISDVSTTAFATNAQALTNFLSLGEPYFGGTTQRVRKAVSFDKIAGNSTNLSGAVLWDGTLSRASLTSAPTVIVTNLYATNGTIETITARAGTLVSVGLTNAPYIQGNVTSLTNGYWTNAFLDLPTFTNAINYGDAFSSPGTNIGSQQFGGGDARGQYSLAIGGSAHAYGDFSIAIGDAAQALQEGDTAVGVESIANGGRATAQGAGAAATATNATALGSSSSATHENSTAVGRLSATTTSNEVRLGSSTVNYVSTPGRIQAESITNALLTGTNILRGDLAIIMTTNATLAATNNVLDPLTNTTIRVSSAVGGDYAINSIQRGRDGRLLDVINDSGFTMTVTHQDGFDPTAGNRIKTPTGGSVSYGALGVAHFRYDASSSRWLLEVPTAAATNSVANTLGAVTNLTDYGWLRVTGNVTNEGLTVITNEFNGGWRRTIGATTNEGNTVLTNTFNGGWSDVAGLVTNRNTLRLSNGVVWATANVNAVAATATTTNAYAGKVRLAEGNSIYYITNNLVTTSSAVIATPNNTSIGYVAAIVTSGLITLSADILASGGDADISWLLVKP